MASTIRIYQKLLANPGVLDQVADSIVEDIIVRSAEDLQAQYGSTYKVAVTPKTITMTSLATSGPIDLKEGFKRSRSAKPRVDKATGRTIAGSWYLIVPIRRKTKTMSSALEKEVRNIEPGTTQPADYLFYGKSGRKYNQFNPNKATRSHSVTRSHKDRNNRTTYTSMRTVSDRSPKDSWILNRDIDRSVVVQDLQRTVKRYMEQALGN